MIALQESLHTPPMGVIFGEALYPVPSHYRLHMHRRLIRGLASPST